MELPQNILPTDILAEVVVNIELVGGVQTILPAEGLVGYGVIVRPGRYLMHCRLWAP